MKRAKENKRKICFITFLDHFDHDTKEAKKCYLTVIGEFIKEDEDYIWLRHEYAEFLKEFDDGNTLKYLGDEMFHKMLKAVIVFRKDLEFEKED